MAVDRRALRKFPGRKRVGRHRRRTPSVVPAPSVADRLGLAICSRQLVDADIMQKAFEYDQAALLRTFVADRRARIRAVQAIFKLMCVDHFDPIKKMVWTYIDQPLAWQFLADAGWADCDATTQSLLNDAERNGRESIEVPFRAWTYRYSIAAMTQVNLSTGRCRDLRRSSPWTTVPAVPRFQYQTRFGWSDCDLLMQRLLGEALRDAERAQTAVVQRMMRETLYEFDFVRLTQMNIATRRVRALRFGTPANDDIQQEWPGSDAITCCTSKDQ